MPQAAKHHTGTYRVRVVTPGAVVDVATLRGVAWRAACTCGYIGPSRRDRADARIDIADHLEGAGRE